jgi:hypothetical protein
MNATAPRIAIFAIVFVSNTDVFLVSFLTVVITVSSLPQKEKRLSDKNLRVKYKDNISSIQTLLSPPESNRFSHKARGVYRRSGIAPCPEFYH